MNRKILIADSRRRIKEELCDKMLEISGFDPRELTRRRPVVMARVIVCYVLTSRHRFTEDEVAILFGIDHATVNHYKKRMEDIFLLPGYEAEDELWDKFKAIL
jgi:predicted AAA+ superfamily ATPase